MSQVVRAYDRARGEDVALKILSTASPAISLGGEFRYIASLNHPGVVSVYDFGLTEDGRPYFTMELLEEGDLLDLAGKAKLVTMLRTAREVFRTLDFVHARGIVHADLKPSNIMLGKTGDGKHYPRLLDFGIAWQDPNDQTGGTVHFMAPELFTRGRDRDHRSDLYSMGVVLFEMLTGDLPFDDVSAVRLAQHHVSTPAPDPRDYWPQLPGELAELILRLLEKRPNDRFQSGREVVGAIDAYLEKQQPNKASRGQRYVIAEPEIRIAGGSRHVGHEAELETLVDDAGELLRGGMVRAVVGESGVGKTRLLNELRVRVQLRGVDFLRADVGGCSVVHEVLDRLAATVSAASPEEVAGASPSVESAARGDRLILDAERIAEAALSLATRRPLVVAIDGLAQLSAETLVPLRAFAKRAAEGPLLIVVASRLEGTPETTKELAHLSGGELIRLHRVSKEACAEIIRSLLGEVEGADAIVDHVYNETGGNPGAIERVVQALVASHAIVLRRTAWVVAPERAGQLPKFSAEAELRTIAASMLAQLSDDERRLARVAANVGEVFDLELVSALYDGAEHQETLNRLAAARVLEQRDAAGDWQSYRFAQRALRDVLLEETPAAESKALSEDLVAFLRSRPGPANNRYDVVLARHLVTLSRPAEAAEVVAQAIDVNRSPSRDLVELLRRALAATASGVALDRLRWCELSKTLADIDLRQNRGTKAIAGYQQVVARAPAQGMALSLAARCELGELLMGDADEGGEEILRDALDDAKALGDDRLVARTAYALANRLVLAGRHEEATPHVSEALLASERSGADASRARTLKLCATLNWLKSRPDEAERYARKAAEEYRRLKLPQGIAASLGALGGALFSRGAMADARAAYVEALEHAHAAGWLTGIGKLEDSLAAVAYHQGDWSAAEEHQAAAITILDRVGNRTEQVVQIQNRAVIAVHRGEVARARALNDEALQLARRTGYRKAEAEVLSNLGELSLGIGALEEAEQRLAEAIDIARSIGEASVEIEAERRLLEVQLARHAGPMPILEKARELLERAEEASLQTESLHISRVAGVALARLREPNQAKEMLDRAHEGFTELGSRYEAARTVRIMAELVTQGLIEHEDMEEQLRKACRVFRRLRAQPELDAARRIRDRLGIPPSSVSLLAEDTGMPRDSAEYVPEVASSAEPRRTADWDDRETRDDVQPPPAFLEAQGPPAPYESGPAPASSTFHDRPTTAPVSERELVERAPTRASFPDLVDVSRRLSEILDLEELLAVVIDAAIASSSAQRGFVIACDRAGHPTLRVSRGLGGLDLDDDLELSRTAVGRVIATRQRVHWQADETDRPNVLGESVMLLGLQAIVALPMINRGQLWGVLYLDTRIPDSDLTGSAMAPLEALAAHAAVAIQNARLFEELGRRNELIASAINELRHPLDALQRCAEIAYQQSEGMPTHRLNQTVRTHARRLNVMVERVLELATTEPAKVDASKVSVQVRDLVDSAILQLRPVDDIDDTPLEIDVPWALPTVLGHREQLIQVIASMVAAALHRSPPDATVSLVATVTDAPMPDDDSDPFFPPAPHQLADDGAVRVAVSYVGTADDAPLDELGLAIAREIVEHHGGHWRSEVVDGRRCLEALLPSLVPMPDEEPASAG